MSVDVSVPLLKVEKSPQLEAGIRDRDLYAIVASLLLSVGQVRMLINVENAPGNIKPQIMIFVTLGGFLSGPLNFDGPLDQRLWRSARLDLQLDKAAFSLDSKVVEIVSFGDDTLADDQDSPLYFPVWAATP